MEVLKEGLLNAGVDLVFNEVNALYINHTSEVSEEP